MITHRYTCRGCKSNQLLKFLELGDMPLAGAFLTASDIANERKFPLDVYVCRSCSLVQILDIIRKEVLFTDYKYLASVTNTLRQHFVSYAQEISSRFLNKDSFVVEIGSNDGVLLQPLKALGIKTIGVEPASNVAQIALSKGLSVINNFFTEKIASQIFKENGKADLICANNVFAHIDDLDDVMKGITLLLCETGIFVFEVHYVIDLLDKNQFDTIYHEHLCYYSVTSLKHLLDRFGMEIFDIKRIPIHSGSIRVYAKNKSNRQISVESIVTELINSERDRVFNIETYKEFARVVAEIRNGLLAIMSEFKKQNKKIAGYGAPGRGTILLNYCNIGKEVLDYIVDESSARQGMLVPGKHIPIVSRSTIDNNRPDYILIIAWSYEEEILRKEKAFVESGGKFIVPLPSIRILPGN